MHSILELEWWHDGAWRKIGWLAGTPQSQVDLREHGAKLAAAGGHYRLVSPSIYRDAPPDVIHVYPVKQSEATSC